MITEKPAGVSVYTVNLLFPLFLESGGRWFWVWTRKRYHRLGFRRKHNFSSTLALLVKAGWLITSKTKGIKEWNLDKVAPEWKAALAEYVAGQSESRGGVDSVDLSKVSTTAGQTKPEKREREPVQEFPYGTFVDVTALKNQLTRERQLRQILIDMIVERLPQEVQEEIFQALAIRLGH